MIKIESERNLFWIIWSGLDTLFSSVEQWFIAVFDAIPKSAIAFLIAIISYTIMAFLSWCINRMEPSKKRIAVKVFYWIYIALTILFTIWRLGVISLIEAKLTLSNIGQFLINMFYIVFAVLLGIVFYKDIPHLKTLIVVFTWICFSLFTFVIGPYVLKEIVLSSYTLYQFLLVIPLFGVPNIMNEYLKMKKRGM